MAAFQGPNNGQEFLSAEHRGAAECGLAAGIDQSSHSPYVVVVPVGRDDQRNSLSGVEAKAFKIAQGPWCLIVIDARVDDDPNAVPDMEDDALAISGAK